MISFSTLFNKETCTHFLLMLLITATGCAQSALSQRKPVPRMQVIPLPYHQASFQRDGVEIARYHFGPSLHRGPSYIL